MESKEEKEINDKIEEWHNSDSKLKLHEYLGMSIHEYAAFLNPLKNHPSLQHTKVKDDLYAAYVSDPTGMMRAMAEAMDKTTEACPICSGMGFNHVHLPDVGFKKERAKHICWKCQGHGRITKIDKDEK